MTELHHLSDVVSNVKQEISQVLGQACQPNQYHRTFRAIGRLIDH